jgi:hypothetical protein
MPEAEGTCKFRGLGTMATFLAPSPLAGEAMVRGINLSFALSATDRKSEVPEMQEQFPGMVGVRVPDSLGLK